MPAPPIVAVAGAAGVRSPGCKSKPAAATASPAVWNLPPWLKAAEASFAAIPGLSDMTQTYADAFRKSAYACVGGSIVLAGGVCMTGGLRPYGPH